MVSSTVISWGRRVARIAPELYGGRFRTDPALADEEANRRDREAQDKTGDSIQVDWNNDEGMIEISSARSPNSRSECGASARQDLPRP